MPHALHFLGLALAGWVTRHQEDRIDSLREEHRVLREHRGPRPLRLTDAQRRRLAVRGQTLGRRIVSPAALQSIALVLRARQRIAQQSNLFVLSLDQRVAGVRRRRRAHIGHASVMPESRNLYKYDILDRRRSGDETR